MNKVILCIYIYSVLCITHTYILPVHGTRCVLLFRYLHVHIVFFDDTNFLFYSYHPSPLLIFFNNIFCVSKVCIQNFVLLSPNRKQIF
jgi:hypothetical protein